VPSPSSRIKKLFAAAQLRLRRKDTGKAAALFLEVIGLPGIETEPLALESAHAALAEIYVRTQKLELAEFHIAKALAVNPGEPDLHRRLGELYVFKGDFAAAAASFLKAVELEPHHPEYLHLLGWATFMAGDQAKGRSIMERSYGQDEANVQLLADLALACSELGDSTAALKYLDQAVELDPKNELWKSQRERVREKAERRRTK
jgi:Flp pilus assembly protein TadD